MTQRAGTVGLVSDHGFATGCIRAFTRSHWNHIVIALGDGRAVQAMPGGVQVIDEATHHVVWIEAGVLYDPTKAVEFLRASVGEPYNWLAIAVFAVRTFAPWLPHRWLSAWANNRPKVICSELAVDAWRAAGVDLFPGRPAATVSPGDIDVEFRLRGW